MTRQRGSILFIGAAVLLALAVFFAARFRPDTTLIGGAAITRLDGGSGPTGRAQVALEFSRASEAYAKLNVGIDLNGDGAIADYKTVGGAVQRERVVVDGGVAVIPGPRTFAFDIADPDVVTRNNFRLVAVLTKKPLGAWSGAAPLGSAVLRAIVSAITNPTP